MDLIEWLRFQDKTYGAEELGKAADEIERLQRENEELREANRQWKEQRDLQLQGWGSSTFEATLIQNDQLREEIERMQRELAEAKKDAERYRWLANDMDGNAQDDFIRMLNGHVLSRALFDEAIDQAMREGE